MKWRRRLNSNVRQLQLGTMGKYKVLLRGQNFLLEMDGEAQKLGFYTTRFVEGNDRCTAEQKAISSLRDDPELRDIVRNESSDAPMLFVEQIDEIDSFAGLHLPGTGFSFYRDGEVKKP
jgi:hypothetical protein